jgi:hypothetical protein
MPSGTESGGGERGEREVAQQQQHSAIAIEVSHRLCFAPEMLTVTLLLPLLLPMMMRTLKSEKGNGDLHASRAPINPTS